MSVYVWINHTIPEAASRPKLTILNSITETQSGTDGNIVSWPYSQWSTSSCLNDSACKQKKPIKINLHKLNPLERRLILKSHNKVDQSPTKPTHLTTQNLKWFVIHFLLLPKTMSTATSPKQSKNPKLYSKITSDNVQRTMLGTWEHSGVETERYIW